MVVYGEALAEDSKVPVAADSVALDTASPDTAKMLLEHAQKGLTMRKPRSC